MALLALAFKVFEVLYGGIDVFYGLLDVTFELLKQYHLRRVGLSGGTAGEDKGVG